MYEEKSEGGEVGQNLLLLIRWQFKPTLGIIWIHVLPVCKEGHLKDGMSLKWPTTWLPKLCDSPSCDYKGHGQLQKKTEWEERLPSATVPEGGTFPFDCSQSSLASTLSVSQSWQTSVHFCFVGIWELLVSCCSAFSWINIKGIS